MLIHTNNNVEVNDHITKYLNARLGQMLDSCAIKFIRIHSILRLQTQVCYQLYSQDIIILLEKHCSFIHYI